MEIRTSGATTKNVNGFLSHSQYGEDITLNSLLSDNGYFLEIGAYHPFDFSNTRFLVEKGWGGCYIDGCPYAITRFIEEYKDNPKIKIIQTLIGSENGLKLLHNSLGDAVSTTDNKHKEVWKSHPWREMITSMVTIDKIYEFLPLTVDFINVDVEGYSADLAKLIDYNKLNTKVICIEHDNKLDDLNNHFMQINFKLYGYNHTNVIFVKDN